MRKLLIPLVFVVMAFTVADKPVRHSFRYARTVEITAENDKGLFNGKFQRTFDGKEVESGTYDNGKKVGVWTAKTINGQVLKQVTYKNDQIDGPVKVTYPDGRPRVVGTFREGLKVGKWSFYNKNGVVVREGNYNDKGEPVGVWTLLNEEGRSIIEKYDFDAKKSLVDTRANLRYDNSDEQKMRNLYMDRTMRVREVIDVPVAGARPFGGARKMKEFFCANFEIPQDCWYAYVTQTYFNAFNLSKAGALSNVKVTRVKADDRDYKGGMDFYFFTEYENKLQRVSIEERTLYHLADKLREDFQIFYGPWIVTSDKELKGEIQMTVVINQ